MSCLLLNDLIWHLYFSTYLLRLLFPTEQKFAKPSLNSENEWGNTSNGPLVKYVKLRVRMRRECEPVFPATAGKQSRHASRHVRHARAVMHAGIVNSRFPLNSASGENVPGIPGACATRNVTYPVRGPLILENMIYLIPNKNTTMLHTWMLRLLA